jgi:hypothetical protein
VFEYNAEVDQAKLLCRWLRRRECLVGLGGSVPVGAEVEMEAEKAGLRWCLVRLLLLQLGIWILVHVMRISLDLLRLSRGRGTFNSRLLSSLKGRIDLRLSQVWLKRCCRWVLANKLRGRSMCSVWSEGHIERLRSVNCLSRRLAMTWRRMRCHRS